MPIKGQIVSFHSKAQQAGGIGKLWRNEAIAP